MTEEEIMNIALVIFSIGYLITYVIHLIKNKRW